MSRRARAAGRSRTAGCGRGLRSRDHRRRGVADLPRDVRGLRRCWRRGLVLGAAVLAAIVVSGFALSFSGSARSPGRWRCSSSTWQAFGLYQLLLWPLAVQDPGSGRREALRDAGVALVRQRRHDGSRGRIAAREPVGARPGRAPVLDDHDRVFGARGRALRAAPERGGRGEAMAGVTYENVWKRFDGAVAVQDFSLAIDDGEFMVLVGPSGCGKSTALRMLAGLERATEGRIMIGERVVNNVAPARATSRWSSSLYALYPHMTVYDNLAFALRNQRVPRAQIEEARQAGGRDPPDVGAAEAEAEAALGGQQARRARARDRARAGGSTSWTSRSRTWTRSCASRRARESLQLERLGRDGYVTHDRVGR